MSELSINTPILTADYADSINADIQRKIDGKLFLFCNYSPDVYPVFTEKEVFEVSLNDLYRLVCDAGFVLGNLKIIVEQANFHNQNIARKVHQTAEDIKVLTERVKALRIYKTHNCDERNGFFAQLERLNFETAVGRRALKSEDDYRYVNTNLLIKIRDSLVARIIEFIDAAASLDDKDKGNLIVEWRKEIIRHYSKSHNQIYLGQLMSVMSQQLGQTELNKINSNNAFHYAQEWIQKYYLNSIQALHDQEEKCLNGIREAEAYMENLKCDDNFRDLITSEKEKEESKLLSVREKLKAMDGFAEKQKKDLFDIFFDQLNKGLEELASSGNYHTLLPQDFLQEHIAIHFNNVPLPVIA